MSRGRRSLTLLVVFAWVGSGTSVADAVQTAVRSSTDEVIGELHVSRVYAGLARADRAELISLIAARDVTGDAARSAYLVLSDLPLRFVSHRLHVLFRVAPDAKAAPGLPDVAYGRFASVTGSAFIFEASNPLDALLALAALRAHPAVHSAAPLIARYRVLRTAETDPCACATVLTGCVVPGRCGCGNHTESDLYCYVVGGAQCIGAEESASFNAYWRACEVDVYPNDPMFHSMWNLRNIGQAGGPAGIDTGAFGAWNRGYTGRGVTIAVVDDGVYWNHEDLRPRIQQTLGRNWNGAPGGETDPTPSGSQLHGTMVAGLAAATVGNGWGIAGVAPSANLVSFRLLGGTMDSSMEAEAFGLHNELISIKSNSWGPTENSLSGPAQSVVNALRDGTRNGRGGLGVVYVFAGGNDGPGDNVNNDGYANSIFTIAVNALNVYGKRPWYAEPGCCLLISAPSGDSNNMISTTMGGTGYRYGSTGTSAAAPQVSGVIALMLEANPKLSWRDVREVLIASAALTDDIDPDWQTNGAGYHFNHYYGAGRSTQSAQQNSRWAGRRYPPRPPPWFSRASPRRRWGRRPRRRNGPSHLHPADGWSTSRSSSA